MEIKKLVRLIKEMAKQGGGRKTALSGKEHELGINSELTGKSSGITSSAASAAALKADFRRTRQREISSATAETKPNAVYDINVGLDNGDTIELDSKVSQKAGNSGASHGEVRSSSPTIQSVMRHLDSLHGDNESTKHYAKIKDRLYSTNPDESMRARRSALNHIYKRFAKLRTHKDPKIRRSARQYLVTSSGSGRQSLIASTKPVKSGGHETVIFDKKSVIDDDEALRPPNKKGIPYSQGNKVSTFRRKKDGTKSPKGSISDGHFRFSITGDQLTVHLKRSAYSPYERRYDQHGNTIKESFFHILKILRDNV